MTKDTGIPASLLDFALEERLKDCPMCRLPAAVRDQLPLARKKKIAHDTMMAWLQAFGYGGSDDEYTSHVNGHHDRKLRELREAS